MPLAPRRRCLRGQSGGGRHAQSGRMDRQTLFGCRRVRIGCERREYPHGHREELLPQSLHEAFETEYFYTEQSMGCLCQRT